MKRGNNILLYNPSAPPENKPLKEGTKIKHNQKMQMECFLKFLKKFVLLLKTNGAQKRLIDSFRKV